MSDNLSNFSESSILCKAYVCVYYGCSKRPSHVIDIIGEHNLNNFVNILGGDSNQELREKFVKKPDNSFESIIKTFHDLKCPEDVTYKVFEIKYDEIPCMCAEDYGEKMYCIQKGNYSIKQILNWVIAAQNF